MKTNNFYGVGDYNVREPFVDGFLYILYRVGEEEKTEVKEIVLNGGYDEPYTLDRIVKEFPTVFMVLFDTALSGSIYRYNNYLDNTWDKVGETVGYA